MRSAYRKVAGVLIVLIAAVFGFTAYLQLILPDRYYVVQGESFSLGGLFGLKAEGFSQTMPLEVYSRAGNSYQMQLTLPGGPVVKTISVQVVDRDMVIPGGRPFGIKMFTEGVMVVGMSDMDVSGQMQNPAKRAGIKAGDIILEMNGQKVSFNEDVGKIVSESNGQPVDVMVKRDDKVFHTSLQPISSPTDGVFRAGIWVRDSSAGIGTMTYYNPATGVFGGLGHAICDIDTGDIMPLASGEAVDVTITGVNRGSSGSPGELKGMFSGTSAIGSLILNGETGVFGTCGFSPIQAEPVELAVRSEVELGPATIYTTVNGKTPEAFSIVIEKIAAGDNNPTKNMVIRVTDPKLLEKTGGIVQGMSGSPILQNGRLVGAVTHVFVNDPTRGYGIFAENMERSVRESGIAGKNAA
ncbi:MAG TPA: SpoIVB peptidase [Candidatus Fimivivens faecavium]|nr:SpoIVB peptidase [Candidatus Fimivivens faecavium]